MGVNHEPLKKNTEYIRGRKDNHNGRRVTEV